MSDIPSDVLRHMLLRLPAESLIRFRAVCKRWRRTIDDPSFIRSHADNQECSPTLLIRTPAGSPVYFLDLDSLNYSNGHQVIEVTRVKTMQQTFVPRLPRFPIASCHGLVLISPRKKPWFMWNPLTRKFIDLPDPKVDGSLTGCGLGYDSDADDYKAVRIDKVARTDERSLRRMIVYKTQVYSRRFNSWKMIKDFPCDFPEGSDPGVFLHGALHWQSRDRILALDLSTEDYFELPLPPEPSTNLSAIGGSLVMSSSQSMWLFEEVDERWTEMFSYEHLCIGGYPRPIAYLKSGQVILQGQGSRMLYWFDIEKNTAKKFTIDELPYPFTCQICPGSLFQRFPYSCDVRRIVFEKSGETKRKRSQRLCDRRLKWSVRVSDGWCGSDSDYSSDAGWGSEAG